MRKIEVKKDRYEEIFYKYGFGGCAKEIEESRKIPNTRGKILKGDFSWELGREFNRWAFGVRPELQKTKKTESQKTAEELRDLRKENKRLKQRLKEVGF